MSFLGDAIAATLVTPSPARQTACGQAAVTSPGSVN